MTSSNDISVLIVDPSHSWAPALRARLVPLGIRVHVVSTAQMALRLAGVKKINVTVLEYALDQHTTELCANLKQIGVPCVFTGSKPAFDRFVRGEVTVAAE